jgi:hypothetical protein
MKLSGIATAAMAGFALLAFAAPGFCARSPEATPPAFIMSAEVMPMRPEAAPTLNQLRVQVDHTQNELRHAKLASFYSPAAELYYGEALDAMADGHYGRATKKLSDARAAVAGIPNWRATSTYLR